MWIGKSVSPHANFAWCGSMSLSPRLRELLEHESMTALFSQG
jgi:hypothetical protein